MQLLSNIYRVFFFFERICQLMRNSRNDTQALNNHLQDIAKKTVALNVRDCFYPSFIV